MPFPRRHIKFNYPHAVHNNFVDRNFCGFESSRKNNYCWNGNFGGEWNNGDFSNSEECNNYNDFGDASFESSRDKNNYNWNRNFGGKWDNGDFSNLEEHNNYNDFGDTKLESSCDDSYNWNGNFGDQWNNTNAQNFQHHQRRDIENNNYNPQQFQQPDCNRVPPFHPNPNEMYNERRPWHNNHHHTPSHYDYTRRPNKRRPSHLMDIWTPNYDEDEYRRDRYTFNRSHSPNNRRYELKPVTFIDRPHSSRFKKSPEFYKNKTSPTSTYTNKTVNADTKEKKPSNPSTSTSTEKTSNPKPKPDEPKSISDGKIAESKSPIVEKVIETPENNSSPDNISPETQVDILLNSSETNKREELEDSETKQKLQEVPSELSPEAKSVPLPVDDQETSIDIEKALKTITNDSDFTIVDSSDADDIVVNTGDTYLFTVDDIDKNKSYLDYNEVIDMDLGSPQSSITHDKLYLDLNEIIDMDLGSPLPSPSIDETNTPCMTQDELLRQLNEEIGDTSSNDIITTQVKVVLDSSSDNTTKSKLPKRSLSQTDGSDDIKKRKISKSDRRYSTYAESVSPSKIKDRRASTSSESSRGTKSKNKSSKDAVEPTEEVKINPYYPSLSQYKIPKKKPAFSSPDRPFCTSISELFGEYDKDDNTKSTSQEVIKDTGRTKKGWDEYSKPEQKDSKNVSNKHMTSQEANKDIGRNKKGFDEYSKTEQKDSKNAKQITSQEVDKDIGRNKKSFDEYSKTEQKDKNVKQITSQEVDKDICKNKKDCGRDSKNEQKDNPTIKQDTAKTKKSLDYSKPGGAPKKKIKAVATKDIKVSQKANNVNEATKAVVADKAKKIGKGKIIQKSSSVKESVKTADELVHTKIPGRKPNASVSSKKDVIKSDKSKYLIVKENKKRSLEPNKQDSTKSEKNFPSTKEIGKSDKQKSIKRSEESKSQKNPEKRRKTNTGSDDAGQDKCHSKQSNLETEVTKPSSEEKVDETPSKIKDNKCASLTDDLLSVTANQKHALKDKIDSDSLTDDLLSVTANNHSEPADKINTPSDKCALTDDLLSITENKKLSESRDKINIPSDKYALTDDLLSIATNKKHQSRDKINTPSDKCALNEDLLSTTENKKLSEARDKVNTPSDKYALSDDLLSIATNKKHSESRDKINTPSDKCALNEDLLSTTENKKLSEARDKVNTPSDKYALSDDLLSIATNKKHSESRDKINKPSDKCALNEDLLSTTENEKRSEPRDKVNTPSDKYALTDDLLSIATNKKHSESRDKINTPSDKCALNEDLLSTTENKKLSESRDKINTPSDKYALTDYLLSIAKNKKHSESKDKINTPSDKCALTDDLLSITANKKHSEPRDKMKTPTEKCALTDDLLSIIANKKHSEASAAVKVDHTLLDSPDQRLEAQHEKLLSLVTSISHAENQTLSVEETRSEASKNTSIDANKIDFTANSADKTVPNDATITSPPTDNQNLLELINKLNKHFSVVPEQEVTSKAPPGQQTTSISEDDKSEPIKLEIPSNPIDIQIKTAVKSEHSDMEKVQPLILDPFPVLEKPRISLVESDCIEEAFLMESPDLHEKVEIVIEEKTTKENDSQDVIEIKEDITIIDLTDDAEEIVVKEDLLQIMEDIDSDSTEKITLYRSEESQDNAEEDDEVQAMSASLVPSAVLNTDTKTEPIKSEVNFTNISSPESAATTPNTSTEDVRAKKENLTNSRIVADNTKDKTNNSNSSHTLPPLMKAKTFLSVNKNLFEKDANDSTETNSDRLKNGVEVSAGQTSPSSTISVRAFDIPEVSPATTPLATAHQIQGAGETSSSSSIPVRALDMPVVLPTTAPLATANQTLGVFNNEQRCIRSGAPAPISSIPNDANVHNGAVSSADRTPVSPSSLAIGVSVQADRIQQWASSAIGVPNNGVTAVSVQADRFQDRSFTASRAPSNNVPVTVQERVRSGASVFNSSAPNDTVSSANRYQGWTRSFSVPNGTVTLSAQSEQWETRSSASAIGVSVPNSSVPPVNRTHQWTGVGTSSGGVSVSNDIASTVNQSQGWTRCGVSASAVSQQQQGANPLEQWPSRTLIDVQSGNHNQNRSTGTVSNETTVRGNENDTQQANSSLPYKMPSSSSSHSSWHQCMADFVVLAIKNHILSKQNLKSSNVCPLTQKVEQLVIDFRWKIYGEQIMRFLSNTTIEEMEPIQNMVTIYERVQSHGLSSLPQFFLCLDAIMSHTKEFYLNHRSLWKFYQLVNANAREIRLKANQSLHSALPRPVFTQQQIGTLNTQIDFCNMITIHYQNKNRENNVPNTRRRNINVSNAINQNSFTVPHKVPARQSRPSAQVARNVALNQHSPNMFNTMLPPQRGNQQPTIQQQRPVNKGPNVYVQPSNTPYSNVLKQLLNEKQPVNFNPPNSTFKVPSQLRYVRKNLPSSSTVVNEPPTNSPIPVYGMSPAYNAPVQNPTNESNAPTFRRDTPRYVMPSMTNVKKHIYAPMMFTPNYSIEKTPSPVSESPAPPCYQSPSHESPIVFSNKETPPAMSPIFASTTRNQVPVTGPSVNTSNNQTSFNEFPVNEPTGSQSPINERVAPQSPINEQCALQSPINERNALQSPINEPSALQSPVNDCSALQSPINESSALRSPINESSALRSPINERGALQSPVNVPLASPSPVGESTADRAPSNESPINESVDSGESCDSGTKVNEDDEVVIDLTWLDDFDCDELKQEVDFITIKKEEFDEDEVVLNEEQFPLVYSPTDSGIESSPSPQVEYSELVYHGRLCICEQPAEYVCECRLAMYCSNSCQNGDWTQHKRICLKAKSKQTD